MHKENSTNSKMHLGLETVVRDTKVEYSNVTHLIEQSTYRYSLQEREDPNLYRRLLTTNPSLGYPSTTDLFP